MRQTVCPLCHSEPNTPKQDFDLHQCEYCGITWTVIKEDLNVDKLYQDEVYSVVDNRDSFFEKIIFRETKKVIHRIHQILGKSKGIKVLDFGAGKGHFLYQASASGWETLGIETSKPRADFAREKYGLNVSSDFYTSGKIGLGNFDVITLFHVLEHLPKPIELVRELVQNNLASKGILVIEVPNYNSWQAQIAGKEWMHLDIPKHLTHWDENKLLREMAAMGFSPVSQQYFSVHLGILGMLRALMGKFGYSRNIIVDLKNNKSLILIAFIGLFLPLAFILEGTSILFKKGGIMRIYFQKNE